MAQTTQKIAETKSDLQHLFMAKIDDTEERVKIWANKLMDDKIRASEKSMAA